MVTATNRYCEPLGIPVPSLAAVRGHREASTYSLMIVSLLEHGRPMTLDEIARELVAAGAAEHVDDARRSLQRCRPARAPVYRDGDLYALDPHDAELDLWAFRLGLRPPRVARPEPAPPPPRPPVTQRLTVAELDAAWGHDASLNGWSAQRIALAILDAHDPPMTPEELVAFVAARTKWHRLTASPTWFRRPGAAVTVDAAGTLSIVPGAPELAMARDAVRDAVARHRRYPRTDAAAIQAAGRAYEQRRAAHAVELAALRRVLVHAFPATAPQAVVVVDVDRHALTTLVGGELANLGALLQRFDLLCGVDIRGTLRALAIDAADRRLAELGPPQKTVRDAYGRTLKITTAMLIHGSCGISRPLGDDKQLRAYLAKGQLDKLAARLEADAKALFALHAYGRTQGRVRLRAGGLDEVFPAPWHHHDEPTLYHLKREAAEASLGLIAVVGPAPAWDAPWARARRLAVVPGDGPYDLVLVDELGRYVDDRDVQLARLEAVLN
ncbi:MAG TPA: hypothetical protein VH143_16450 [Kofleriaceae bacterium]|jgi:hypothetical protein|nr:hypothetical protein [Kofleriaceae bacterium]